MRQTAFDRLDTWVLIGSLAFLVLCIVGLILLTMLGRMTGNFKQARKAKRESPEPMAPRGTSNRIEGIDDLEQLQRDCAAMESSLADMYLKLGESWLRKGERRQAEAMFQKVIQIFPELAQAVIAQERLEAIKPSVSIKPL